MMGTYHYKGVDWVPSPTVDEGNSFYHSVFGERSTDKACNKYKDNDVNFHLEYFPVLKRFVKDSYSNPHHHHHIDGNRIIASLENIRIVIFKKTPILNDTEVIEPNEKFLGNLALRSRQPLREVVVGWDGSRYVRYDQVSAPKTDTGPKTTYNKLSNSAGIKGGLYQVNLLTIFMLNGLKTDYNWRLSTENSDAGKFDDLVFEILPQAEAVLLQAKYKKKRIITLEDLTSTNSKKDDFSLPKYFFSYFKCKEKFNVKNVCICTNADIQYDKLKQYVRTKGSLDKDDIMYFDGIDCVRYTFNKDILCEQMLKDYDEFNFNGDNFQAGLISDNNIEAFLQHFQFIGLYPRSGDLDSVIEKIVFQLDAGCFNLKSKDYPKYIIKKMIEWFEEEKGVYQTKETARALFSEIMSNKLCEKLHDCRITFKEKGPTIIENRKRLLHIVPTKGFVLSLIRVHLALHEAEEQVLFVNPLEDMRMQLQAVDAFQLPSYNVLVVCLRKPQEEVLTQICDKIKWILQKSAYKRVIVIADQDDKLAIMLRDANKEKYEPVEETLGFDDLTDGSQAAVLEKVIAFFHSVI